MQYSKNPNLGRQPKNGVDDPNLGSWNIARWAISDAATTLLGPGFTDEEIPALLEELNNLVAEIHFQNP